MNLQLKLGCATLGKENCAECFKPILEVADEIWTSMPLVFFSPSCGRRVYSVIEKYPITLRRTQ